VLIGVRLAVEEGLGSDDEARCADSALQRRLFEEGLLERVKAVAAGDAFDSDEVGSIGFHRKNAAGVHETAIEQDAAGAAVAVVAPFLGADQAELVAEHFEQALARLAEEFGVYAIEAHLDLSFAHG